jgi:carboxypeptidase Taq
MTASPAATRPGPGAASAPAYSELCELLRQASTIGSVTRLLQWDQETYMPHNGAAARAEQQALMAAIVHARRTSPRIGELIAACEGDRGVMEDGARSANVREMRRDFDMATKLPGDLVAELAKVGSQAQEVWKEARQKSDFAMVAPWLERMIGLTRRKAECYGVPRTRDGKPGELYDALLDEYEPGVSAAEVAAIFAPLRERLARFIGEVRGRGRAPSDAPLLAKIDPAAQHRFGQFILEAIRFDLKAGRLDVTTHPFCEGLAPGDTRLTTRYRDEKFTDALYGTMHEAGHGLYEQGLPKLEGGAGVGSMFGQPLAEAISLGIHESQSRMWENFVGRSREFWEWALPHARKMLTGPDGSRPLEKFGADDFYKAVNTCTPSFIRVEADESTYNLLVMVRFEIERALMLGSVSVRDIPAVWNRMYKDYLGVDVPDDRRGCLQDVHWSFGLIGYFPTYTLGNLYAGQLWETINAQNPTLNVQMKAGEFGPLREWLRENIHQHGKRYRAAELCRKVTGKALSAEPFLTYLEGKIRGVYGV